MSLFIIVCFKYIEQLYCNKPFFCSVGVPGPEHSERVHQVLHHRGPVYRGLRRDPRVSDAYDRLFKLSAAFILSQNHVELKLKISFHPSSRIIPIYLVHRPSNDIPYATLEEELIGDFVKYSVKDGKEINLRRRDSEAGQKCCAFQHWVYHKTEGNLLVTDMQGQEKSFTFVQVQH